MPPPFKRAICSFKAEAPSAFRQPLLQQISFHQSTSSSCSAATVLSASKSSPPTVHPILISTVFPASRGRAREEGTRGRPSSILSAPTHTKSPTPIQLASYSTTAAPFASTKTCYFQHQTTLFSKSPSKPPSRTPSKPLPPRPKPRSSKKNLSPEVDPPDSSETIISTVLESSIRLNLQRYPEALLLTQVGSFFESYFDQAPIIARALNIKLTSKQWGKGAKKTRFPMCGFPTAQLGKHASRLVEEGWKVVVVEEGKDETGAIVRRVTRIVTPGTGIDEGFVKNDSLNFILAVAVADESGADDGEGRLSLSYRDISTGAAFSKSSNLDQLRDDILVIGPKEIVVDKYLSSTPLGGEVLELLKSEDERESWTLSTTIALSPKVEDVLDSYLAETLLTTPPPRVDVKIVDPKKVVQIDSATLNSLEIRSSLRGGLTGSLIGLLKKTSTPGGYRLLVERLCAPSTELDEINSRLSLVSTFKSDLTLRKYLLALLKPLADTPRILQRLSMRRGTGFDLLSLKKTILAISEAHATLTEHLLDIEEPLAVKFLLERLQEHTELAKLIENAIDEDALVKRTEAAERRLELLETYGPSGAEKILEEGDLEDWKVTEGLWGKNEPWVIKPDFSVTVENLHEEMNALRRSANQLELSLRKKYDSQGLVLKIAPKFGPIVHVTTRHGYSKLEADPAAELMSKSGSTRSYVILAWSTLSPKIDKVSAELREVENKAIAVLIDRVLVQFKSLHKSIEALDELDVSLALAEVATDLNFVRPTINNGTTLDIVDGRHPSVENALRHKMRDFTSNSVHLSHPSAFIHCITGPNMAGKSTFLRQTALIVILAQAGSFVPASSASIGIVDKVFSRVGARDELDRDKSTFRIEMDEAASILHQATDRSLVLMDELGRGTSPLDGLAIAFAALESLLRVNCSRTLFATHYHRLGHFMGYKKLPQAEETKSSGEWEGLEFWCTDIGSSGDYSRKVRRGLNDDSAGLRIARSAGLPDRVLEVAENIRKKCRGRSDWKDM